MNKRKISKKISWETQNFLIISGKQIFHMNKTLGKKPSSWNLEFETNWIWPWFEKFQEKIKKKCLERRAVKFFSHFHKLKTNHSLKENLELIF